MKMRQSIRTVMAIGASAVLTGSVATATAAQLHRHQAIAGAKRYNVEQISDKDVNLSDRAVQGFIQSDLFHKMSTDRNFAKTVLVPVENGKQVLVPVENGKRVLVPAENGKRVLVPVENGRRVLVPVENG